MDAGEFLSRTDLDRTYTSSWTIKLVLIWTNAGFNLQTAPALTGPFTNLPGATSPYTHPLTAPQQFFRRIAN